MTFRPDGLVTLRRRSRPGEEWHDGAVKLVEILAETTRRLGHAAVAHEDQEDHSGKSLRVPVEIEL